MQQPRRALGRGLESLLSPTISAGPVSQPAASVPVVAPVASSVSRETLSDNIKENQHVGYHLVPIEKIVPNRQQPRSVFDDEKLKELSDSIKEQGVLQPLVVTQMSGGRYELIAGERRLRASKLAGMTEVPVVIKNVDSEGLLTLAILENVQREDLNPIEEAFAYQELTEQFGYTHDEIAQKMGKSRTAVANTLRLLQLPQVVREDVAKQRYSAGHARAILGLSSIHEQMKMREIIIKNFPSVRDVEMMVRERGMKKSASTKIAEPRSPQISMIADRLRQNLGTKVNVKTNRKGGGKITIDFFSEKDLDRLYRRLTSQ